MKRKTGLKILYYNTYLDSKDGSSSHAKGILESLVLKLGKENIYVPKFCYDTEMSSSLKIISMIFKKSIPFINVIRWKIKSNNNVKKIVKEIKLKEFSPNIILARSTLFDETPLLIAKHIGCKLVLEHNAPLYYEKGIFLKHYKVQLIEQFESKLLHNANGVYYVSLKLKDMIEQKYELNEGKSLVLRNGYNSNINMLYNNRVQIRKDIRNYNNVVNKKVILFIGSLQKWHGINQLLEIADRFKDFDNIEFWVIGDGVLSSVVSEFSYKSKNLKYFGIMKLEKLYEYIFSADIGIMPYINDEVEFYFSPLKMFDMIGGSLPFIGLNVEQISKLCMEELNEDFLYSNFEELVKKLQGLVNDNKKLIEMQSNIDRIRDNHSWSKRVDDLILFIEEIIYE